MLSFSSQTTRTYSNFVLCYCNSKMVYYEKCSMNVLLAMHAASDFSDSRDLSSASKFMPENSLIEIFQYM